MKPIVEIKRLRSPFERPQAIAWDGSVFWMSSIVTDKIYAVDPASWTVKWECAAPGKPWGIGAVPGDVRVICANADDSERQIRRCVPFEGFDPNFSVAVPDTCGSHLSFDGSRWNVSQWYLKKIVAINPTGAVERTVNLPRQVVGHTWALGGFSALLTDDEKTDDYWFSRVTPSGAEWRSEDRAHVPFQARALAFDGRHYWTNHREQHETVCFGLE
ncbi:MAG TPA: hypothetical protein VGL42_01855 [Opitutaceae bacterium]|jgi:hypothetical protein